MKKEMPIPEPVYSDLFALPQDVLKWELLRTAIELKVFDHLSGSATVEKISTELSTHPANTEYFLNALVALGCLRKTDGEFSNTPLAESFLTCGKDTSIGDALLYLESWVRPVMNGGMLGLVRNGPPLPRDIGNEDVWEKGARASVNHSRCGRAQRIAELVSSLPEFPSFSRMLDMGAGPGIMGIAVAAAHPDLECVLFDQPAVCKVADEVIAEYGMGARCRTERGDYMNDHLGTDYDFIMANYTLNFYRDRLDEIIGKVYNVLKPDGVFMVTSDGLNRDKTAPATSVLSWLPTSLQGMDMSFESGMVAAAMLRAGFVSTELRTLTDIEVEAHGPVEMTVGRKG